MSFVGPRPERPEFVELFSESIQDFEKRCLVKPGLSGLAQIHGDMNSLLLKNYNMI